MCIWSGGNFYKNKESDCEKFAEALGLIFFYIDDRREHVDNKSQLHPWPSYCSDVIQVKRIARCVRGEGRRRSSVIPFRPTTRAGSRQPRSLYQETSDSRLNLVRHPSLLGPKQETEAQKVKILVNWEALSQIQT